MIYNSKELGIDLMAKDNEGKTGFEKARFENEIEFLNLIKNNDVKIET